VFAVGSQDSGLASCEEKELLQFVATSTEDSPSPTDTSKSSSPSEKPDPLQHDDMSDNPFDLPTELTEDWIKNAIKSFRDRSPSPMSDSLPPSPQSLAQEDDNENLYPVGFPYGSSSPFTPDELKNLEWSF